MARIEILPAQTVWLLATSVTVLAPLVPHVPPWLTGFAGLALAGRALLAWKGMPLPPRWLLFLLVAGGTAGVVAQYRTLFGQNPGVALLVLFMALKQLETRSVRDGLSIVFLGYFLSLAQFFYAQGIVAALATATGTLVATATLASLADPRPDWALQLRRSGIMLLQATPLMLLLFLLFPRVEGPLWGLPKDAHSSLTGLAETMAPGSISQLSQSDDIAFRVRFTGPEPARRHLYWRGPVLTEFDGRAWRPSRETPQAELPYPVPDSGGIDQEITLEPHGKAWIFALEFPGSLPANSQALRSFQLQAKAPVTSRIRYQVRSYPDIRPGVEETPARLRQALAMPPGTNPRTRALAESWRTAAGNEEEILRQAQAFFLRQGLVYTLEPPLLGPHTADEFLFDTRMGFCEHFANAFAIAMRAAGVPARVVTGYQGGDLNPVDGYLTVHQYDAHAWTEVWLAGKGWLRVDPTAISAPARLDQNLAAAVPAGDPLPLLARLQVEWLQDLRFRWDAMTNAWNQWVLGYTPQRQRDLLERLGMPAPDWQRMTMALTALAGLATLILTAWMLRRRRRRDPASILWERVSRRLARRGLGRHPWEGPLDYAERIAAALPEGAADMRDLARLYSTLRYARAAPTPARMDELRRRVACFRP